MKKLINLIILIFILTITSCSKDNNYKYKDGKIYCNTLKRWILYQPISRFDGNFSEYNTIKFEGTIKEILPPIGFWSGTISAHQGVVYKIDKIIVGKITNSKIVIYHLLLPTIYCNYKEPFLSKYIFKIGNRLFIRAKNKYYFQYTIDDNAYNIKIII